MSLITAHMDYQAANGLNAYTFGAPTTIRMVEIWRLKPTNQGFLEARQSRIWEPDTK